MFFILYRFVDRFIFLIFCLCHFFYRILQLLFTYIFNSNIEIITNLLILITIHFMGILFLENKKKEIFKSFFDSYYAPFCIYAQRFVQDSSICEDIVSDVFVNLWEKLIREELEFDTVISYIKVAVRNNCLNYIKHEEHEQNYANTCKYKPAIYAESADSIYTLTELQSLLDEALNKLPESYRQIFIKCFMNNESSADIAKDMNVSTKTVFRYKSRVVEHLREELKEYFPIIMYLLVFNHQMHI